MSNYKSLLKLILLLSVTSFSYCEIGWNSNYNGNLKKGNFVSSPLKEPPTVRPPPYAPSFEKCPEINLWENWVNNLCGDLNKGYLEENPLGHTFSEGSYPFELIKNKTLKFFRHALPVLKNDKSVPKVAKYKPIVVQQRFFLTPTSNSFSISSRRKPFNNAHFKYKRSLLEPAKGISLTKELSLDMKNNTERNSSEIGVKSESNLSSISTIDEVNENSESGRSIQIGNQWRKQMITSANAFCHDPTQKKSLLCKLYKIMWGKQQEHRHSSSSMLHQYQNQHNLLHHKYPSVNRGSSHVKQHPPNEIIPYELNFPQESKQEQNIPQEVDGSSPDTPCPSSIEYVTPVFARNHEGSWRYVVQIPREGYFTQTVEVTKCVETKCFWMDGTCKTSPRWQSLLVAELFYPHTSFPIIQSRSPVTNSLASSKNMNRINRQNFWNTQNSQIETRNNSILENMEEIRPNSFTSSNYKNSNKKLDCDGIDEIGCFQVRLFYDWFLIPGSCKCWKHPILDFTRVHSIV